MAMIDGIKKSMVDRSGREVDPGRLTETQTDAPDTRDSTPPTAEQTSRIGMLHWEVAGHPSRGLTPAKLATVLAEAEQGNLIAQSDLFQDMEEKDAHIFAELSKRRRSVMGLDWTLVPPRNATAKEKQATADLEQMVRSLEHLEDVIFEATDAIGKGYACQEIRWDRSEGEWMPVDIDARPQRWFTVLPWDRNELRLRDPAQPYGDELWPFGWIVHKHRAKSGYIGRSALFRVLAWPYLFKQYSVRDLAEFLEIYGLPLRLGKYPPGSSDMEKSTLLKAVMAIGHSAAGIIPQGMEIDFKEAAKGASGPFEAMIRWAEISESKAIVGQTLTADAGSQGAGSRALGEVHDEVRWDITVSDAKQLAPTLTQQLVYPLGMLNGLIKDPRRAPRFAFDVSETEDLGIYAEALPKLVGIGFRIPQKWGHERLGIPEPAEDEPVLQVAAPQPAAPVAPAHAALAADAPVPPSLPDQQLGRLQHQGDRAVLSWVEQIRAEVDQASSLEDLRDRLLALYPDLDSQTFGHLMGEALLAANLGGRFDVQDGN